MISYIHVYLCRLKQLNTTNFLKIFIIAPRVVVYDNACNLHSYCLNRDPAFFKNTQFLVDRLRWADHTGLNVLFRYLMIITFSYLYDINVMKSANAVLVLMMWRFYLFKVVPARIISPATLIMITSTVKSQNKATLDWRKLKDHFPIWMTRTSQGIVIFIYGSKIGKFCWKKFCKNSFFM